jgi:hypothetical protein
MRWILTLATLAVVMPIATSASAQVMTEAEREQAYNSCVTEYVNRNMGNHDAAVAYCYDKYYGENPWSPPPRDPCSRLSDNCTRPD